MATRTVNTKSVSGWNSKTFFPKDNYKLRCIGEEVAPNSNGNVMVTLEWEVVNCEPKRIGDSMVDFDGVKFKTYHVTKINDGEDAELKSDNCFKQYQDRILIPLGIDVKEGWDDENPPSVKGKVVHAAVYGKENTSFKSPTPEQKAQGKKTGDVLKDPITGKDVVIYQPQIEQIYGLCTDAVRPY